MNPKSKKERAASINRFNKTIDCSNFLEDFQEIMIERLALNYERIYSKKNVERIIRKLTNRNPKMLNTSIKKGLLLSCNIDASIYILIQETNKKIYGEYMPMDVVIQDLLIWYVYFYSKISEEEDLLPPFVMVEKSKRKEKLTLFNKKFKKFYKNI